jgi:hypothetical protein
MIVMHFAPPAGRLLMTESWAAEFGPSEAGKRWPEDR